MACLSVLPSTSATGGPLSRHVVFSPLFVSSCNLREPLFSLNRGAVAGERRMHQRLFASGNEEQDIITCTHVYIYPATRLISSRIDQRILEIELALSFSRSLQYPLLGVPYQSRASVIHPCSLHESKCYTSASCFILRSLEGQTSWEIK